MGGTVVTVRIHAALPIAPAVAFAGLVPFDAALRTAPAVDRVDRSGDGTVGTTYTLAISRYRRSAEVHTTVTAVDRGRSIAWSADRPVAGRWEVEPSTNGSAVTVEVEADDDLVAGVELPRMLVALGIERLLKRGFQREFRPVVGHIVSEGGGDSDAIAIEGPHVIGFGGA